MATVHLLIDYPTLYPKPSAGQYPVGRCPRRAGAAAYRARADLDRVGPHNPTHRERMTMSEELAALHASVGHLRTIVGDLSPDQLRQSAYPTEWTIADVLSHVGSGGVIMRRGLEDTLAGREPDGAFNQSVWDEWVTMSPDDQAAGALAADATLVAALDGVTEEQRSVFRFAMGPMSLDFAAFVGLRLADHVVHTWNIEVVFDPGATLSAEAMPVMVDGVSVIAGLVGRPPGTDTTVPVRTSDPDRGLALVMTADSVRLTSAPGSDGQLSLPAEAFIRLVYGRLDPDHTPAGVDGPTVEQLRQVFPGF